MKKSSLKHLSPKRRFLILSIAGSVALISGITGVSAYRTHITTPLSMDFKMRFGDEFKITISDSLFPEYPQDLRIIPGEILDFQPCLTNTGNYDTYAFVEVSLPDTDFSLLGLGSDWTRIETNGGNAVYAYGSKNSLYPLKRMSKDSNGEPVYSSTTSLCTGISLDPNTDLMEQDFSVSAVGYAIQSSIKENNPAIVWEMIEGELASQAGVKDA